MNYYTVPPSEKIAAWVNYFWIFEGSASQAHPFTLRTVATGFPELIFHYQGTFNELSANQKKGLSFTAGIHAHTNRYRDFAISENFGMIGVHLYPHALETLFGVAAPELVNQLPDLSSIKKTRESHLQERVFSAKSDAERIALLSDFILSGIKNAPDPAIAFAVKSIIENKGVLNIDQLSAGCFVSKRQFERRFKNSVGFTAKYFSRLIRFNSLLNHPGHARSSLLDLSFEFGYYDQSHFISEFKEFSGQTPGEFLSKINR